MSAEDTFHLGVKALIRNEAGSVLLLQVNPEQLRNDRRTYWDLPGGRVQQSDSVEDTLIREVQEETGVTSITDITPVSMVLSNIRIPVNGPQTVGLILSVYTCKMPAHTSIKLSEEHSAFGWFSPQEAAMLLRVKYPVNFCEAIAKL